MSPAKRSALMSRIKGTNTGPERKVRAALLVSGVVFEVHARDLPGRPDFIFRKPMVALFVDGDFGHGWRFPIWRDKLSEKWEAKIAANRRRDARNFKRLRRQGWKVIRLWEHQIENDLEGTMSKVVSIIRSRDQPLETAGRAS